MYHYEKDGFLFSIKHADYKPSYNKHRIKFGNDAIDVSYDARTGKGLLIEANSYYHDIFYGSLSFHSQDSLFERSCNVTQLEEIPQYDVIQITVECSSWL